MAVDVAVREMESKSKAVELLDELADWQNGPPLVAYEEGYNKTMSEVWAFLEAHEKQINNKN